MSGLYGNGMVLTEKVLDYLWGRQNLTLYNIANNETPGYKSRYLTFESELDQRIKDAGRGDSSSLAVKEAIQATRGSLHTTWSESTRLDGNNVDVDQEQVELVRTAYEYQYMINSITSDINRLKNAARAF